MLLGCKPSGPTVIKDNNLNAEILGFYASSGYEKRSEGYDWVSVLVTKVDDNSINIAVRSRADKKKPTCTFDGIATLRKSMVYELNRDGIMILFNFSKDTIDISTESEEDSGILYYFCSGGATLEGSYKKTNDQ